MNKPASSISPAETSSATPLMALNAVCIDSETTGLDVTKARIIQIGGVRLNRGQIDPDDAFEQFIDPGGPIPPASSRIHGLFDGDVKGAETFRTAWPAFASWIGRSVVLGYSIGFDLAMFKREHDLSRMGWTAPRCMDVRHLAQLAAPQLPDHSLDTLAEWLGVTIHKRHSALGDAMATAQIFMALVPRLQAKGIRTIAEAERGSLGLSTQTISESKAGWHGTIGRAQSEQSIAALARVDSFPYRHRVSSVMHTPPIFTDADAALADALGMLIENQISSAFVKGGTAAGIITERDILRAIDTDGAAALTQRVGEVAKFPLRSIAEDAYVYRAIAAMREGRFRHLGVHDKTGAIVGALSARDLLKQRGDDAISLGDRIETATSAHGLSLAWANLALVAQALVNEAVDVRDIAAIISRELCALTRRAVEIAERNMSEAGLGEAPCDYAMLVLGSAGRGESLLAMDQDNAIVYAEGDEGGPEDTWFAELGSRVADMLNLAGVPYCKGGVMASNRAWRMSVADWREHVLTWISRHTPEDILNSDIFFDATAVHGKQQLADDVLGHALSAGAESREFLQLMSVNAVDIPETLGWFGRIRLKDGRIDLKRAGIMPIFSAARIVAIRHGITARSTPERLESVKGKLDSTDSIIDNLIEAHKVLLGAILDQQLKDLDTGIALSNNVAVNELPVVKRDRLKWALAQVRAVSNLLGDPVAAI